MKFHDIVGQIELNMIGVQAPSALSEKNACFPEARARVHDFWNKTSHFRTPHDWNVCSALLKRSIVSVSSFLNDFLF
jgi:hypothetical protein